MKNAEHLESLSAHYRHYQDAVTTVDLAILAWASKPFWIAIAGRLTATTAPLGQEPSIKVVKPSWMAFRTRLHGALFETISSGIEQRFSIKRQLVNQLPGDVLIASNAAPDFTIGEPFLRHQSAMENLFGSRNIPVWSVHAGADQFLKPAEFAALRAEVDAGDDFAGFEPMCARLGLRDELRDSSSRRFFHFEVEVPIALQNPTIADKTVKVSGRVGRGIDLAKLRLKGWAKPVGADVTFTIGSVLSAESGANEVIATAPCPPGTEQVSVTAIYGGQTIEKLDGPPTWHNARVRSEAFVGAGDDDARELAGGWVGVAPLRGGAQAEVRIARHGEHPITLGVFKRPLWWRSQRKQDRERFVREVESMAKVQHPFVVRLLDHGKDASDPWCVTEYAPCGSLWHWIIHLRGDVSRCLRIARDVASGLHALHQVPLIHRDVKPDNILLRTPDHAIVADMGIAYDPHAPPASVPKERVGAHWFAPPEASDDGAPEPSFDVYSLGKVIYCMISGTVPRRGIVPFQGDTFSTGDAEITSRLSRPELQALNGLFAKMITEDRSKRFQEMGSVIAAIDQTQAVVLDTLASRRSTDGKPSTRKRRRERPDVRK